MASYIAIVRPVRSYGSSTSVSFTIPDDLAGEEYLFVRVGARSSNSNELIYTQVEKLEL